MIVSAITLDDCTDEKWTYRLQYMGRMYTIDVDRPLEAMSTLEQEQTVNTLHAMAFMGIREKKLMQRPEDALDEGLEQAMKESLGSSYEDAEEDEEELDLYDIIVRVLEEIEEIKKKMNGDQAN